MRRKQGGIAMNFEPPQSEQELEFILRTAYEFVLKSRSDEALAICNWLIEEQKTATAGYRQRAVVLEYMGNVPDAISDLEHVVSRDSREPADFHALGILYFKLGEMAQAEAAFTSSLALGKAARSGYYKNSCHIFRAEVRLKLKDYKEALVDAQTLPDLYSTQLPGIGMRSKEKIIADAERELSLKEQLRPQLDRKI
jgi:tetratricopeptide (TPR) repeat protein